MLENGNAPTNGSAGGAVAFPPPVIVQPRTSEAPLEDPTPETLVFRAGLVTPDQLGELVQERVRSGRPLEEIIVERGWANAAAVAEALGRPLPAASAPPLLEPPIAPQPVAALIVEPLPAPAYELPATSLTASVPLEPNMQPEPIQPEPLQPDLQPESIQPEPMQMPEAPALQFEPPVTEPASEEPSTKVSFRVSLRLAGELVEVSRHAAAAEAKHAAQALAGRVAAAGSEWPFVAGRYVRPDAVTSIEIDGLVG